MVALVIGCKTDASSDEQGSATSTGEESGETGVPTEDMQGGGQCELVVDDCMDSNLKCMPYSDGPGPADGTSCCPLDPTPVSFGERCHMQEMIGSCLDDCPAQSWCMVDDLDTLEGYCQPFCDIEAADACPVDELCMPLFENVGTVTVPMCIARCDPLQQDCESKGRPGWVCIPTGPQAPEFACLPKTGPTAKLEYESCLVASDCTPGLMCSPGALVLGCEDLSSCCTRYCDINEANPCTMGNECESMNSPVPGLEHIGLCVNPL
jgi:hypothetical protein